MTVAELAAGSTFAGYRIEGIAGRGGMGVVYRATHLALDRTVALKLIAPELTRDRHFRERFQLESRLAASLDHPHVIPIDHAGEEEGTLFIAMRFIDGIDLSELLARVERLEPRRAGRLTGQIGEALDAAHSAGLVHRDVKPANVLIVDRDGDHAYLTDFGLTKRISSIAKLTPSGELAGTPDYMAPEQIAGLPVDARTDVYALGCLLFELLTGDVPYPRDDPFAKLYAHAEAEPPRPSERAAEVPAAFDAVVARAMAKAPKDRYPSAGDLGRAAESAAVGRRVARSEGSVARGAASPRDAETGPARRVPARRRRVRLVGALLAAVAVAAIVAAFQIGGSDTSNSPEGGTTAAPRTVAVGRAPSQAAVTRDAVWVANTDEGTVSRIDPRTSKVVGSAVRVGRRPLFVAAGEGAVWVSNSDDGTVTRIDARSNRVTAEIEVGGTPLGVAAGAGAVWVVDAERRAVVRIDPRSNSVVGEPIRVGAFPFMIAVGAGSVWVTNQDDGTVSRIDARSGAPIGRPLFVGTAPAGIASGAGAIWVANGKDDTVTRIDPGGSGRAGEPIRVGRVPQGIAVGGGTVWVVNEGAGTVARIDPRTNAVIGRALPVGRGPLAPAFGHRRLWVPNGDDNTVSVVHP